MKRLCLVTVLGLVMAVPMVLFAEDKPAAKADGKELKQSTCPLSGKPVDKSVSVKHDGQEVYFCCENCLAKYKTDPAKYADALKPVAGLVAYGPTAQDDLIICPTCAVKGGIHKRSAVKPIVYKGVVYGTCAKALREDPATHLKALQAAMVKQLGEGKWYTCAMHPAVLEKVEGQCPVCDIKLTPLDTKN